MAKNVNLSKTPTIVRIALFLFLCFGIQFDSWAIPPAIEVLRGYEQMFVNRLNDSDRLASLDNHQSPEYSPEKGQVFLVKSFWVSSDRMNTFDVPGYVKKFPIKLWKKDGAKKKVLFIVHPESEEFYRDFLLSEVRGPDFFATATASSRTLLMWLPQNPSFVFFGKLSLDREIGGVVRTIPAGEVARSVGVSKILDASKTNLPRQFKYFPEFFGTIPKGFERGGMILRFISEEIQSGEESLIPLFALYTQSPKDHISPIEKMLSSQGESPKEFVRTKILQPFARLWVEMVLKEGVAIEAHSQNLLLGLDVQGMPDGDFYFRDFGGFNIALAYRRQTGRAMPADLPYLSSEEIDYHLVFHQKAIQQSLENYFEGGFLFGLGLELERLGYYSLGYSGLKSIFRSELDSELGRHGIQVYDHVFEKWILGLNYQGLSEKIIRHRANIVRGDSQAPSCSSIVSD